MLEHMHAANREQIICVASYITHPIKIVDEITRGTSRRSELRQLNLSSEYVFMFGLSTNQRTDNQIQNNNVHRWPHRHQGRNLVKSVKF